jgi:hypothetical protein
VATMAAMGISTFAHPGNGSLFTILSLIIS